jgi:hypothetical protein
MSNIKAKISRIVSEQIQKLKEEVLSTHDFTVDNFDLVSRLMNFNSDDDFYFVEVIKRKKDNPNDNFHYCQYLSSYWVKSAQELQSLKQEIIDACVNNNARAYIFMNPRSAKAVNDWSQVLVKRFQQRGKGYSKYRGHEKEVAAGQQKDWNSRPISFIDIDSADQAVFDKVHRILDAYDIKPMAEYKTPNGGLHILLPDKSARYIDWSCFDDGKHKGLNSTVHFNIDCPTLLFSDITPTGY